MVVRRAGLVDFSAEQLEFLTYGRVLDTGRLARDFHFTTRYSTVQAFDDFVRSRNLSSVLAPDTIAAAERAILATVSRRRTDG
jgi:UDP-glucose 4-epimerase